MKQLPSIGLFCGTFNPIHNAHLLLAQCACDQFNLHKIYFVTSPRPPHRHDVIISGETRHAMVSGAVSENEKFIASRVELDRQGLSYTIDTIMYFKDEFDISLIIGADNIIHLPTWHKFDQIVQICKLLVAPRRFSNKIDSTATTTFSIEEHVVLSKIRYAVIDFPLIDIASSYIRSRIKEKKTVRYMVPEKVWQIMQKERYFN